VVTTFPGVSCEVRPDEIIKIEKLKKIAEEVAVKLQKVIEKIAKGGY
jgi:hypothetical protein